MSDSQWHSQEKNEHAVRWQGDNFEEVQQCLKVCKINIELWAKHECINVENGPLIPLGYWIVYSLATNQHVAVLNGFEMQTYIQNGWITIDVNNSTTWPHGAHMFWIQPKNPRHQNDDAYYFDLKQKSFYNAMQELYFDDVTHWCPAKPPDFRA